MTTVEVAAGSASVKVECGSTSPEALLKLALSGLEQAHEIEQKANRARADRAGGTYV